jgi:hypothetical protein
VGPDGLVRAGRYFASRPRIRDGCSIRVVDSYGEREPFDLYSPAEAEEILRASSGADPADRWSFAPMSDDELAVAVRAAPWRTARSSPHQYILRYWDARLHDEMVKRIALRGRLGAWGTFVMRYLEFEDYRYWVMNSQQRDDILLALRWPDSILNRSTDDLSGSIRWLEPEETR